MAKSENMLYMKNIANKNISTSFSASLYKSALKFPKIQDQSEVHIAATFSCEIGFITRNAIMLRYASLFLYKASRPHMNNLNNLPKSVDSFLGEPGETGGDCQHECDQAEGRVNWDHGFAERLGGSIATQ